MNTVIANLRIWQKAMLPLVVMFCTVILLGYYMTQGMSRIDESYSLMIDKDARSALWATRSNATMVDLGRVAYRTIAETDDGTMRNLLKEMDGLKLQFAERTGQTRKGLTNQAQIADLVTVEGLFNEAHAAAVEAGRFSLENKNDEALAVMQKRFNPIFDKVRSTQKNLVDTLTENMNKRSNALSDETNSTRHTSLVLLAVSGLLSIGLGVWIAFSGIVGPVARLTESMRRLAERDWQVEVPGAMRKDELGHMARAVAIFKTNGIEGDRIAAEQQAEQVKKEARAKAVEGYIKEFDQSVASILQMVSSASTELQTTAQSMSATAEETSRQSTAVAAASEQASTNVQTVASAAEELSSSIAEITRQVSESTRITTQAVKETERTNAQIQGLAEAAQRIGDVVKLINDIAGQTNLLALNATIEAARAGEAGKGFAVVASEVKSLANQTAKATEEISSKISEMQAATGQSVEAVQTIGQTIGRVNEIATTIASAVEEQGAATKEIARNVQQASAGTNEVSSNIVGVTKAATDTGAAASQVLSASGELAKQAETLRGQVDGFLAKIRAA